MLKWRVGTLEMILQRTTAGLLYFFFSRICTRVYIVILEEKSLDLTRVPLLALVFCGKLHREGKQPELNAKG